jgi:hypothetical protein
VSELKLRIHDVDPDRAERIRLRCVTVLQARRLEAEARRSPGPAWRSWLEPAIAVSVGVLYVADAFARALAFFR